MSSANIYKVEVDETGVKTTVYVNDINGMSNDGNGNETEERNDKNGNDKRLDDVDMDIEPTSTVLE